MANMNGGGKISAGQISIADPQITVTPSNPNRNKTGGTGGNGKKK